MDLISLSTRCVVRAAQQVAGKRHRVALSCRGRILPVPSVVTHRRQLRAGRTAVITRAENKDSIRSKVDPGQEKQFKESLDRAGIDKATANKILEIWQKAGVDDPDKLRQLLVSRSLVTISSALVQLALDGGAGVAAYLLGMEWLSDQTFGGVTPVASAITFLVAGYFATGAIFDLFTVGAVTIASLQFRSDSAVFLAAVKDIAAGGKAGLGVVEKASAAVSMVKVIDALNQIQAALQEDASSRGGKVSTLDDLSAYLTLSNAEKKYGFSAEKYGLSDAQASDVALEFAKFDTNDDGRLQLSEFEAMVGQLGLGASISEDEVAAAFNTLDLDGNALIDFEEFVQWWQKNKAPVKA